MDPNLKTLAAAILPVAERELQAMHIKPHPDKDLGIRNPDQRAKKQEEHDASRTAHENYSRVVEQLKVLAGG
jgi:hypothetical protein